MMSIIPTALGALPIVLPCLVGVVMSLTLMSRARTSAICGALGFALSGGVALLASIMPTLVSAWMDKQHQGASSISQIMSGMYFVWALLRGIAFVLLIVAIIAGRQSTPSSPR